MNRLIDLMKRKKVLSVRYSFPMFSHRSNIRLINSLAKAGADIVDLFIPTEDMLISDKGLIESVSFLKKRKFKKNVLVYLSLLVKELRKKSSLPIIVTGSVNTFFSYGLKEFFVDASEAGVDGLYVIDLPPEESKDFYYYAKSYGIELIFMIDRNTDESRLNNIMSASSSIVYLSANDIEQEELEGILDKIKSINNEINIMVVDSSLQIESVMKVTDGYICSHQAMQQLIGSRKKLIKMIIKKRKRLEDNGIL